MVNQNSCYRPNQMNFMNRSVTPAPTTSSSCGCQNESFDMPKERHELLQYITEVSFAAYDAALYLDTHPDCKEGLRYIRKQNTQRDKALKEYARLYGPLKFSQIMDEGCSYWDWKNQPWPWQGGGC